MTSDEKETIYNLLKLSSCWVYGYKSPKFFGDNPAFDDDVIEFIEPEPLPESRTQASDATFSSAPAAVPQLQAEPEAAKIPAESKPVSGANTVSAGGTEKNQQDNTEISTENIQNKAEESASLSLEAVSRKISACRNCILANTRNNVVPGEGVEHPYVLVIGEGPGEDEDRTGRPFVGKAGQLLDKMLAAISLSRTTNCYIANIVKCRPPINRTPMPDEASACSGFLQAQIHILKPKFILAMGRTAAQNLLKTGAGINALRGQWMEFKFGNETIPLMATYHPSALLRNEALKLPAWQDLKKFREKLLAEKPDYAEIFYSQK